MYKNLYGDIQNLDRILRHHTKSSFYILSNADQLLHDITLSYELGLIDYREAANLKHFLREICYYHFTNLT